VLIGLQAAAKCRVQNKEHGKRQRAIMYSTTSTAVNIYSPQVTEEPVTDPSQESPSLHIQLQQEQHATGTQWLGHALASRRPACQDAGGKPCKACQDAGSKPCKALSVPRLHPHFSVTLAVVLVLTRHPLAVQLLRHAAAEYQLLLQQPG
jgi:hypothetical protein